MITAQGISGVVSVGYQTAAILGAWELEAETRGALSRGTVRAVVREFNSFWFSNGEKFTLMLKFNNITWTFHQATLHALDPHKAVLNIIGKPSFGREA